MEGIFQALSSATHGGLPSGSAADIASLLVYGKRSDTGESFLGGGSLPVGQGALPFADGSTMFVPALAQSTTQSPELLEAKLPFLFERWEFTPDSCGPGKYRGGSGWEVHFTVAVASNLISVIERTKVPGWAQLGGKSGAPNRVDLDYPDGRTETIGKVTDLRIPAGTRVRMYLGGGGGYGPPAERAPSDVARDLENGIITPAHAKEFYSHAIGPARAKDGAIGRRASWMAAE
jgi:N-methylhydantoinase B